MPTLGFGIKPRGPNILATWRISKVVNNMSNKK